MHKALEIVFNKTHDKIMSNVDRVKMILTRVSIEVSTDIETIKLINEAFSMLDDDQLITNWRFPGSIIRVIAEAIDITKNKFAQDEMKLARKYVNDIQHITSTLAPLISDEEYL